jgi:hypothetical protein
MLGLTESFMRVARFASLLLVSSACCLWEVGAVHVGLGHQLEYALLLLLFIAGQSPSFTAGRYAWSSRPSVCGEAA